MPGSGPSRRWCAGLWVVAGIGMLAAAQAAGATLYQLAVSSNGDLYHVTADAQLDADPVDVHAALVDFAHLPQISPDIRKAVVLRRVDAHTEVVYMETRACVGIFCSTLKQTQQFTELSPLDIVAVTLPDGSNVTQGSSSWHLQADTGGTHLYWETSLEPDFWLPPFIGPALVRKALRVQGEAFMNGIEQYAANRRNAAWARTIGGHTL